MTMSTMKLATEPLRENERELQVPRGADVGRWALERLVLVDEHTRGEHVRCYLTKMFGAAKMELVLVLELENDRLSGQRGFFLDEGGEPMLLRREVYRAVEYQRRAAADVAEGRTAAAAKRRARPRKADRDARVAKE